MALLKASLASADASSLALDRRVTFPPILVFFSCRTVTRSKKQSHSRLELNNQNHVVGIKIAMAKSADKTAGKSEH